MNNIYIKGSSFSIIVRLSHDALLISYQYLILIRILTSNLNACRDTVMRIAGVMTIYEQVLIVITL